ncbi:hypothetical protein LXL04_013545 [Taraxacum kok-saghyz]
MKFYIVDHFIKKWKSGAFSKVNLVSNTGFLNDRKPNFVVFTVQQPYRAKHLKHNYFLLSPGHVHVASLMFDFNKKHKDIWADARFFNSCGTVQQPYRAKHLKHNYFLLSPGHVHVASLMFDFNKKHKDIWADARFFNSCGTTLKRLHALCLVQIQTLLFKPRDANGGRVVSKTAILVLVPVPDLLYGSLYNRLLLHLRFFVQVWNRRAALQSTQPITTSFKVVHLPVSVSPSDSVRFQLQEQFAELTAGRAAKAQMQAAAKQA